MTFLYMPILKWKQGEQLTLRALDKPEQEVSLPLIELMPINPEYKGNLKERLALHLDASCKQLLKARYDKFLVGIDTTAVDPTYKSQTKMLTVCTTYLRKKGVDAIPVILPAMVYSEPATLSDLIEVDKVILRVRVGTILPDQIEELIANLQASLGGDPKEIHVLFDMYNIVGTNSGAKADELEPLLKAAYAINNTTTVTVAGGSFPLSLQGIKQGTHLLPRVEIHTYKKLHGDGFNELRFGDYTVSNPLPLEGLDPTKMNPSAQIRYALDHDWLLYKGGGSKTYGMAQYNGLCKLLVAHERYCTPEFSMGDKRYWYHTTEGATSGSYMTWRRDATSHHVVFTARQMMALHGA